MPDGKKIVALLAASFSYIEYDEIGFRKDLVTNKVDTTTVFQNGRYFWGVGKSAVVFKRTLQRLYLDDLLLFTSSGIEIKASVALQWRYNAASLVNSYKSYGLNLEDSIKSVAISAIKNTATTFDTESFFTDRAYIGTQFAANVKDQVADLLFVEVPYLQLLELTLTNVDQQQRYLDAANQIQSNEREQFVQNSTLIRTATANLQAAAQANITVIQAQASYFVQSTLENARAWATTFIASHRADALNDLFLQLGLNTNDLRLNYLYITSMGERAAEGLNTRFLTDLPVKLLGL